jgi:hypothetical protein
MKMYQLKSKTKVLAGLCAIIAGISLAGCGKAADSSAPEVTKVTYMVTIANQTSGQYTKNDSSNLTITGLNFSRFAFITHKTQGSVWQEGSSPNQGIVHVAEWGRVDAAGVANGDQSLDELGAALISNGEAYSKALSSAGIGMGATITFNIEVDKNYPYISFAGMVAPSACFFTGGSNIALYENGNFISSKTVNLYAYSAESRDNADLIVLRNASNNVTVGTPTNIIALVGNSSRVLNNVKAQLPTSKVLGTVTFTRI